MPALPGRIDRREAGLPPGAVMPRNYKATIQYDGGPFFGWQIQKGHPTVQAELVEALQQVTGERPTVIGSGRTDSGVHADGQVANFRLQRPVESSRLIRSLNGVLPATIRVLRLTRAPADFHAQFNAKRKVYWYRIWNAPVMNPFWRAYVLHVPRPLDVSAMNAASLLLIGRHNFRSFAASSTTSKSFERHISLSRWTRRAALLTYQVAADGFLHHMVRSIVGTVLLVGKGDLPIASVAKILRAQDRRLAGPRAPAHGLTLKRVIY